MHFINNNVFFGCFYLLLMKNKPLYHPRLYLEVIKKKNTNYLLKYKGNNFNNQGERVIKECEIDLIEIFDILPNDFNKIINKLNKQELKKIINYIKTQYKVLDYHIKKNNYDSIKVVKDSIMLMNSFKEEILSYEL